MTTATKRRKVKRYKKRTKMEMVKRHKAPVAMNTEWSEDGKLLKAGVFNYNLEAPDGWEPKQKTRDRRLGRNAGMSKWKRNAAYRQEVAEEMMLNYRLHPQGGTVVEDPGHMDKCRKRTPNSVVADKYKVRMHAENNPSMLKVEPKQKIKVTIVDDSIPLYGPGQFAAGLGIMEDSRYAARGHMSGIEGSTGLPEPTRAVMKEMPEEMKKTMHNVEMTTLFQWYVKHRNMVYSPEWLNDNIMEPAQRARDDAAIYEDCFPMGSLYDLTLSLGLDAFGSAASHHLFNTSKKNSLVKVTEKHNTGEGFIGGTLSINDALEDGEVNVHTTKHVSGIGACLWDENGNGIKGFMRECDACEPYEIMCHADDIKITGGVIADLHVIMGTHTRRWHEVNWETFAGRGDLMTKMQADCDGDKLYLGKDPTNEMVDQILLALEELGEDIDKMEWELQGAGGIGFKIPTLSSDGVMTFNKVTMADGTVYGPHPGAKMWDEPCELNLEARPKVPMVTDYSLSDRENARRRVKMLQDTYHGVHLGMVINCLTYAYTLGLSDGVIRFLRQLAQNVVDRREIKMDKEMRKMNNKRKKALEKSLNQGLITEKVFDARCEELDKALRAKDEICMFYHIRDRISAQIPDCFAYKYPHKDIDDFIHLEGNYETILVETMADLLHDLHNEFIEEKGTPAIDLDEDIEITEKDLQYYDLSCDLYMNMCEEIRENAGDDGYHPDRVASLLSAQLWTCFNKHFMDDPVRAAKAQYKLWWNEEDEMLALKMWVVDGFNENGDWPRGYRHFLVSVYADHLVKEDDNVIDLS